MDSAPAHSELFTVLVTDPLHADGLAKLREAGAEVLTIPFRDEDAWRRELPRCRAWLVRSGSKVRDEDLAWATQLRVVGRAGVGVDNVDVDAATRRGIAVLNAPEANSVTTAELAIAHLLALSRNLVAGDRQIREGRWARKELVGQEVEGKRLGVVGLGRIGRIVARKALGLGLRVCAHDPFVAAGSVVAGQVEMLELDEVLARSDYLTLHLPLNDRTRGLIDRDALAKMRSGARLINCARGGLVDEEALHEALQSGHLAGAALDVFAAEPPPVDHPLLQSPRVVATPHLGASTEEASQKVAVAIVEQVVDYLLGQGVRHAINLPALDAETRRRVEPHLPLARRCGRFLAHWSGGSIQRLVVNARGEVPAEGLDLIAAAFLQGLLEDALDGPVNLVNASLVAKERGIELERRHGERPRDFPALLEFRADTSTGRHQVAGTLFGERMARVVLIDGWRVEVVPEGHHLVLCNRDRPGVVGRLGTLLGEAGINIGTMHVSSADEQGRCLATVAVSEPIPDELLARIRADADVESATRVDFRE